MSAKHQRAAVCRSSRCRNVNVESDGFGRRHFKSIESLRQVCLDSPARVGLDLEDSAQLNLGATHLGKKATDLNEAIQMAAKIPPAREGSIEVRPVRELVV